MDNCGLCGQEIVKSSDSLWLTAYGNSYVCEDGGDHYPYEFEDAAPLYGEEELNFNYEFDYYE